MIKGYALAAACALSLAACSSSTTGNVVSAKANTSGPFGLIRPDAVTVKTPAAFKGLNRVVVGSFIVGFSTYDTPNSTSGRNSAAVRSTLVGIGPDVMQRITDDAHAKFVADLKAQGYTVVDRAELMADKGWASTKTYPNPYEDSSGGLFGSSSRISYLSPTGFGGTRIFQGDITGTLGGFAMEAPIPNAANYAKATGTKVIHAVYALGFVNKVQGFRLVPGVEAGQGLTAIATATKLGVVADYGGMFDTGSGMLTLGQPITSEREFASIKETTSSGAKAAEAAVNTFAALSGVGTSVARDYDFAARPADYSAAAVETLNQVNGNFISKMVSLR